MTKQLELFKDLFEEVPNIAILHINNCLNLVDSSLENIAKNSEGRVDYIEFVNEYCTRLKAVAREYEYIVLSDILSHCKDKERVLKTMYKALENSGTLIIIEKKAEQSELLNLLEELNFQAPNNIDLFEEYDLITAKKMHHWGYGL